MKMGRYSNQGLAFSAGRSIASMMAGWLRAAFSSLRNWCLVKGVVAAMCAMNSLTSARRMSSAAAGLEAAHTNTAARNQSFAPDEMRTATNR